MDLVVPIVETASCGLFHLEAIMQAVRHAPYRHIHLVREAVSDGAWVVRDYLLLVHFRRDARQVRLLYLLEGRGGFRLELLVMLPFSGQGGVDTHLVRFVRVDV